MPIRFRCVYCTRLLGIASRKAGAVTRCPQCGNEIIVPARSDDEVEETQSVEPQRQPAAVVAHEARPVVAPKATPSPKAKPKVHDGDEPLFIGEDIDDLLGVPKMRELPKEKSGPKPVSGMDAMSLDDESPKPMVLSPQKATLIVVGLVLLMLLTFAAGLFVGMNTTRGG